MRLIFLCFAFVVHLYSSFFSQDNRNYQLFVKYYNAAIQYEKNGYAFKALESYNKALRSVTITLNTEENLKILYRMAAVNAGNIYLSLNNLSYFYRYYKIAAFLGDEYAKRVLTAYGFIY
jgi:hypothetical protein